MKPEPPPLEVYRSNRKALLAYASRLTGEASSAEDLVHDAWILYHGSPSARTVREPIAYLKRIVRNLVLGGIRADRGQGPVEVADYRVFEQVADDSPSAETVVMWRQELQIVMDTLATLSDRQRAAFDLYHCEGLKLREVAMRLGISTSLAHLLVTEAMQICDERRARATR